MAREQRELDSERETGKRGSAGDRAAQEFPVRGWKVWDRRGTQTKLGQWEAVAEAADEAARPKLGEDNTDAELGLEVYRSLAS